MKNIFSNVAAFMLIVAFIFSMPAAAQELGSDAPRKFKSLRSSAKKGTKLKLNCGGSKTLSGLLAKLDPEKAYTITVSGACTDNIEINSFHHLILVTENGASITDASGGTLPVVNVLYTNLFEMLGFTVNGGQVVCAANSNCFFGDNTFQGSVNDGIAVFDSSMADILGGVIQDNGGGLAVQNDSTVNIGDVTILNNDGGIAVGFNSALFAYGVTVQDNTNFGIRVNARSFLRLNDSTITGNGGDGILAQRGSTAYLLAFNTVTNNELAGVRVKDLSMGVFFDSDVTGNLGGTDVLCEPQFPATRGALTGINGGTTNCVEPGQP